MFKKLLTSALFAGFGAGLIAALIQIVLVEPTIFEAELYETGQLVHFGAPQEGAVVEDTHVSHGVGDGHSHDHGSESNLKRQLYTASYEIAKSFGYALMLVAGFALAAERGVSVTARQGIIWGFAGFIAFNLAPAFGHAPELPGSLAAELSARQIWWALTVIASVLGLGLIGFGKNWVMWGLGIVLLALPHIIGAPHIAGYGGVAPPEMAGRFVALSLGAAAISWSILGLFAGFFWSRDP